MFPLGQNIPDWVFAWNTSLLCWGRMDSVWSLRVHPLGAWRGSSRPALASRLVWWQQSRGQNQGRGSRRCCASTGCTHSQVLVYLWNGLVHRWLPLRPVPIPLSGGESGRALGALFPVRLGFSSRSLHPYFIDLFQKDHPKNIHPEMTNIWIKAKPAFFQDSWACHTYLGPEFGPWC